MDIQKVIAEFQGRRQLAEALDVSRQAVEKWIEQDRIPSPRQFQIAALTQYRFKPSVANPWD